MQVYKAAKLLKCSNKELIQLIGIPEIDHHMDKIPKQVLEDLGLEEKKISETVQKPTETVNTAKTDVVDVEVIKAPSKKEDTCPYTIDQIKLGIRCLGGNAPQYKWRHLIV